MLNTPRIHTGNGSLPEVGLGPMNSKPLISIMVLGHSLAKKLRLTINPRGKILDVYEHHIKMPFLIVIHSNTSS
jgi:hypothetical protein